MKLYLKQNNSLKLSIVLLPLNPLALDRCVLEVIAGDSGSIETVSIRNSLKCSYTLRQHAVTIIVLSENFRSKCEVIAKAFLCLLSMLQ